MDTWLEEESTWEPHILHLVPWTHETASKRAEEIKEDIGGHVECCSHCPHKQLLVQVPRIAFCVPLRLIALCWSVAPAVRLVVSKATRSPSADGRTKPTPSVGDYFRSGATAIASSISSSSRWVSRLAGVRRWAAPVTPTGAGPSVISPSVDTEMEKNYIVVSRSSSPLQPPPSPEPAT